MRAFLMGWSKVREKNLEPRTIKENGCSLLEFLFCWGVVDGFFAFLVGIYGEQHVVIKTVTPVVTMLAEVEINLGALRQPESCVLLRERDGAVFDNLVLAEKLNFRHRMNKVGFYTHDLKLVSRNPGSAFQFYRMD